MGKQLSYKRIFRLVREPDSDIAFAVDFYIAGRFLYKVTVGYFSSYDMALKFAEEYSERLAYEFNTPDITYNISKCYIHR